MSQSNGSNHRRAPVMLRRITCPARWALMARNCASGTSVPSAPESIIAVKCSGSRFHSIIESKIISAALPLTPPENAIQAGGDQLR